MRRAALLLLSTGIIALLAFAARPDTPPERDASRDEEIVWDLPALDDLVAHAGTILSGRILEVREEGHPDYPYVPVTRVRIAVERAFKMSGSHSSDEDAPAHFTFLQFGGLGASRPSHLPSYREGEEVVLFLYPESAYGLTSPVGGSAGKFLIRMDPDTGRRLAVNGMDNMGLFRGQEIFGMRTDLARHDRGPVGYEKLAALISELSRASR